MAAHLELRASSASLLSPIIFPASGVNVFELWQLELTRSKSPRNRCGEMPLYDCMLLLKPHVKKDSLMDLVARVGKHMYRRNGVVTDLKSFGEVQLGYGIKKLDGRYYQGQLMQMTMMATSNINKELQYLHKEDRLLSWLVVKHRNTKFGLEFLNDDFRNLDLKEFP